MQRRTRQKGSFLAATSSNGLPHQHAMTCEHAPLARAAHGRRALRLVSSHSHVHQPRLRCQCEIGRPRSPRQRCWSPPSGAICWAFAETTRETSPLVAMWKAVWRHQTTENAHAPLHGPVAEWARVLSAGSSRRPPVGCHTCIASVSLERKVRDREKLQTSVEIAAKCPKLKQCWLLNPARAVAIWVIQTLYAAKRVQGPPG